MMKREKTFFLMGIAAMILSIVSCAKDGSIGPQGPEGEQGEQGIRGEKGEDGSTIYNGTVVPPASLGTIGDFYLRTSNSNLYGPKTDAGWGNPVNLRGATGASGAAGSKILSGTATPPAANIGAVGDFYLNTSNSRLYGPKTSSGWGTTFINLRGATGATGTANVIYSDWASFPQAQRDTTIDLTRLKVNHFPASGINQAMIDNGEIKVFLRFGGTVVPLPYTSAPNGGTLLSTISYMPRVGRLLITRHTHDNSGSHGLSGALQFRYVLIPGGVRANAALKGIDLNNYEALSTAFNIDD